MAGGLDLPTCLAVLGSLSALRICIRLLGNLWKNAGVRREEAVAGKVEKQVTTRGHMGEHGSMETRVEERFGRIMEGRRQPAAFRSPSTAPPWLDKEAVRRGRQVYLSCSAALSLATEPLVIMAASPNFSKPLVFSRKSHTKQLAQKRYQDTTALIHSWYMADVWDTESIASSMIRRVNAMHRFIENKARPLGQLEEAVKQVWKDEKVDTMAALCKQDHIFLESLGELKARAHTPNQFWNYVNDSILFSQMDMSMVHILMIIVLILFPDQYGLGKVSQNQIKDFVHLWRTNGWYLGIKDDQNVAMDTVEETQALAKLFLERIMKPSMLYVSPDAMYMMKASAPPGLDHHVLRYRAYTMVGFSLPGLWASFSYWQCVQYYMQKCFFHYVYTLSGPRYIANWLVSFSLDTMLSNIQKKGKRFNTTYKNKNSKHVSP